MFGMECIEIYSYVVINVVVVFECSVRVIVYIERILMLVEEFCNNWDIFGIFWYYYVLWGKGWVGWVVSV